MFASIARRLALSLAVAAIAWLHWPLVWVVLGLGTLAMAIAWHRLKPAPRPPAEVPR